MKNAKYILTAALLWSAAASCASPVVPGTYTMLGSRTAAAGCGGSPPSGSLGAASAVISAPDSSGAFTMVMQIGSGNPCVLSLSGGGGITDAHSCDATIAPPFFPVGVGSLENTGNSLRLTVRWSMTGAGSNTMCWTDDVWVEARR
ncbi:MAG: hypothetical protein WCJ30_02115 [Deltaproteobacteria bacterium]